VNGSSEYFGLGGVRLCNTFWVDDSGVSACSVSRAKGQQYCPDRTSVGNSRQPCSWKASLRFGRFTANEEFPTDTCSMLRSQAANQGLLAGPHIVPTWHRFETTHPCISSLSHCKSSRSTPVRVALWAYRCTYPDPRLNTVQSGPGHPGRCSLQSSPPLDGNTLLRPDQVLETFILTFQDQVTCSETFSLRERLCALS
jgi:hypothetical protein